MEQIKRAYRNFIETRKNTGIFRELQPVKPSSAREIVAEGRSYINFSSNDYLGLSYHPSLIKAAQEWAGKYGSGSAASRLVVGDYEGYSEIEHQLAGFKGKETALIMASGYQCNVSVLPALFDKDVLGEEPLVFADRLNHASMHAGCKMAGVKQIRYQHRDMDHLETLLKKHADSSAPKFILTESVFSMDGTIAPMEEISKLAKEHDAFVICDDAHASGILGENGRGLAADADVIIGTFGKAFGSFGAYVACDNEVRDYLINKCGGVIYSTALPPGVWGSIKAALDIVPGMDKERDHVAALSNGFRDALSRLGFSYGSSQTQIIPLISGSSEQALELSSYLKSEGFWASAIRPPTVPQNTARIRFAFNAAHTYDDLEQLVQSLKMFSAKKAA